MSSGAPRIVTGRPCSLLKLRSLAATRRPAPTAARTRSLVLVLPTLPGDADDRRRQPRRGPTTPRSIRAAAVSATSMAGSVGAVPRGATHSVAAAPAATAASTKSCPSRSATSGTNSWPGRRSSGSRTRRRRLARRRRTSVPPVARGHLGCPDPHGAERYRSDAWRDRIHLVVLFGGQSAEHDVSCVTAAHVLAAVDPRATDVTPIGIDTRRRVGAGRGRQPRRSPPGPARCPARLDPTGTSVAPSTSSLATDRRRADRRAPAAARPDGRGRHGAGPARAGRRGLRRLRRARLGAGDGQGDGQAGARRQRHPAGPLPGVRRARASRPACPPSWPPSSGCRASSSRPTWARRSGSARRARSRSCATPSTTR